MNKSYSGCENSKSNLVNNVNMLNNTKLNNKFKKNKLIDTKNGFTLTELLIVLGLLGIIIPIIMSFFIASFRNYKSINDKIELQFQCEYILNFMSDKISEAKYIELVRESTSSYLKKTSEQNITKISFRYGDNINQCYNFEIKNDKIRYGNARSSSSPTDELGAYVKKITVIPFNGKKFEDTEAIIIKITMNKGNQMYEAEQMVYMRNYEMR